MQQTHAARSSIVSEVAPGALLGVRGDPVAGMVPEGAALQRRRDHLRGKECRRLRLAGGVGHGTLRALRRWRGADDCTAPYIRSVLASFYGDWLCGLRVEAVKERARRVEAESSDLTAMLSLAGSMRMRPMSLGGAPASRAAALARSASCEPRLLPCRPAPSIGR